MKKKNDVLEVFKWAPKDLSICHISVKQLHCSLSDRRRSFSIKLESTNGN